MKLSILRCVNRVKSDTITNLIADSMDLVAFPSVSQPLTHHVASQCLFNENKEPKERMKQTLDRIVKAGVPVNKRTYRLGEQSATY